MDNPPIRTNTKFSSDQKGVRTIKKLSTIRNADSSKLSNSLHFQGRVEPNSRI